MIRVYRVKYLKALGIAKIIFTPSKETFERSAILSAKVTESRSRFPQSCSLMCSTSPIHVRWNAEHSLTLHTDVRDIIVNK